MNQIMFACVARQRRGAGGCAPGACSAPSCPPAWPQYTQALPPPPAAAGPAATVTPCARSDAAARPPAPVGWRSARGSPSPAQGRLGVREAAARRAGPRAQNPPIRSRPRGHGMERSSVGGRNRTLLFHDPIALPEPRGAAAAPPPAGIPDTKILIQGASLPSSLGIPPPLKMHGYCHPPEPPESPTRRRIESMCPSCPDATAQNRLRSALRLKDVSGRQCYLSS